MNVQCPTCNINVIGRDCPKCGRTIRGNCPHCGTGFLPCDNYCSCCGAELRFINFTNHPVLRQPAEVSVHKYELPADRKLRTIMAGLWPIKVATRFVIGRLRQSGLRGRLLGSAVKVSSRQFPEIKRATDVCLSMLGMREVEVFISRSKLLSASAYGAGGKSFIVLTSGLVENLAYDELLFIIGRELGHVKSEHLVYLSMISMLKQGVGLVPMFGPALQNILTMLLLPWQRSSELSADRAGLICCQSLQSATKALTIMALGSRELFEKVDLDEFLRQYQDLQDTNAEWSELMQVNPFVLTRIRRLQDFLDSPQWQRIMDGAYHPFRPVLWCRFCKSETAVIEDFDFPLIEVDCRECSYPLLAHGIFCPHCGFTTQIVDGKTTLSNFVCTDCGRPYFMEGERRLATSLLNELPEDCAYSVLGIPFTASTSEIASAYARAMRSRGDVPPDTSTRIAIDRAYRSLTVARARLRHDRKLFRELMEKHGGRTLTTESSRCVGCGTLSNGSYCPECGHVLSRSENERNPGKNGAVLEALLPSLKQALSSPEAFGGGLHFFCEPPFEPVFETGSLGVYFRIVDFPLTGPSEIRELLNTCNDKSDSLNRKSWLSARAVFVVLSTDEVDVELLSGLASRLFCSRRGMSGSFDLLVLALEDEKTIPVLQIPDRKSSMRYGALHSIEELAHFLACLSGDIND